MSTMAIQLRIGAKHELEHTTSKHRAKKIAQDHLREDPKYYTHLLRMKRKVKSGEWNPSVSKRQQRFMCAEYGRKKHGKTTRTGMSTRQLREFCIARVKRKKNPHLAAATTGKGKLQFVGMVETRYARKIKSRLRAQGIKNVKITKDHVHGEKQYMELYAHQMYSAKELRSLVALIVRNL